MGRKWPCEKLMTKHGNDRIIELFWRKGRKQWSIKKGRFARSAFMSNLLYAVSE